MTDPIRLGTRASALARTQSALVGDALAEVAGRPWTEVLIRTSGDDTSVPLTAMGAPGAFVSALRAALLAGNVDVIVHSYKDLPSAPEPGIVLAAVPGREDGRDVLVSRDGLRLGDLPEGATVGTSSPRRSTAIARRRPDLVVVPIRGNVDTRVRKVRDGEVDATVLAAAGLARLGRLDEATEFLDEEVVPAPAQGALAVECRADDTAMRAWLAELDDPVARLTTAAEREILVAICAQCTTAVGAAAHVVDGELTLSADLDEAGHYEHAQQTAPAGSVADARVLGLRVAASLVGVPRAQRPVLLVRASGNERDAAALAELGVPAVADPYLRIEPAPGGDAERLLTALDDARPGEWLIATSPSAIGAWRLAVGGRRLLAAAGAAGARGIRVAATGERTADTLRELGFDDVLVPDEASAAGLVRALTPHGASRALVPAGDLALPTLGEGLTAAGWRVDSGVVYRTTTVEEAPPSATLIADGEVPAIVLRSPSALAAVLAHVRPPDATMLVCAGETTAAAVVEAGLTVSGVSASPRPDALARAVADALRTPPSVAIDTS